MKVTNWSEYNAGLRRRGSLTLWITEEAMAAWQAPVRLTRGGQPHYSDIAIETNLLLHSTFRLPLRQAQGLMGSVFERGRFVFAAICDNLNFNAGVGVHIGDR